MCTFSFFRLIPLAVLPFLFGACAVKQEPAPQVSSSGALPRSGTVTVRSGLAWMPEDNALFVNLSNNLNPLLLERGMTPVPVTPSRSAPLPAGFDGTPASASPQTAGRRDTGVSAAEAEQRGRALADEGKLARLTLSPYTVPEQDADLPPSVTAVRGVDMRGVLFAGSQLSGVPQWRGNGPLPGYVPNEVRLDDPQRADYALLCRFAAVRPQRSALNAAPAAGGTVAAAERPASDNAVLIAMADTAGPLLAAAAPIRGVGSMGYGSPAPAAPPRPSFGRTPGDYRRGYEGNSPIPGDPWGREADMKARNYPQRYGEPPEFASPPAASSAPPRPAPPAMPSLPKPPLPGDDDMPAGSPPARSTPPASGSSGAGGDKGAGLSDDAVYMLELELYALAPAREGRTPAPVWRASVLRRADAAGLAAALPEMAARALAESR